MADVFGRVYIGGIALGAFSITYRLQFGAGVSVHKLRTAFTLLTHSLREQRVCL